MKTRLQITLEDEATALLNKQENKSQYIEELILNAQNADISGEVKNMSLVMNGLVDEILELKELIKRQHNQASNHNATGYETIQSYAAGNTFGTPIKQNEFVPAPPDPETGYPCCVKAAPCKHWVYDENNMYWKNTITNKIKEV